MAREQVGGPGTWHSSPGCLPPDRKAWKWGAAWLSSARQPMLTQ